MRTISDVLDVQYFLTPEGNILTRVIVNRIGKNPITKDYNDASSVLVLHMETNTIKEINKELNEKVCYIGDSPPDQEDALSDSMPLEQIPKPEFIEIRGINATVDDMIVIDNIIHIRPVCISGVRLVKRITYKRDGLFCFSEFPADNFDFVYCSTGKTFSELKNTYEKNLADSDLNTLFNNTQEALGMPDEIPYNVDDVNKESPLEENGMFA